MSVHDNHKGPGYIVRWRDAGGKNRFRTIARKKDAILFDATKKREQALGLALDTTAGQRTLTEFCEESYWPNRAVPRLAPRTRATYATIFAKHVAPHLGRYRLRELTPRAIDDFRVALERAEVGDPTIIKALGILQAILQYAVMRDEIATNPAREIDKPRQRRRSRLSR